MEQDYVEARGLLLTELVKADTVDDKDLKKGKFKFKFSFFQV
jgi:hypothetical protein